jgi:hypothetical protein
MIYCIGDSFTYGDELADQLKAWPHLLGKQLNKPITNLGRCACGSKRIVKRAMDCVFNNDADIIIVAWTNPVRIEMSDSIDIYDIWPGRVSAHLQPAQHAIIKTVTAEWADKNDHWSYRNWLRDIILLQTFFKYHNQRYIMLQSHQSQELNKLYLYQNQVLVKHIDSTYFLGWPFESMMEWTVGVERGPNGHFLEEGHARIADKIYEHIRHLGWVS